MAGMASRALTVNLGPRSYPVVLAENERPAVGSFLPPPVTGQLALVVADRNSMRWTEGVCSSLVQAGFRNELFVIEPGEQGKTWRGAERVLDGLADAGADRNTVVVAVGGGVVGDLAGFVAAVYARGLRLVMVPTTLLAMVDSSIGGKVAVNHPRAKNLFGTFHQPKGVWIDISVLETLPDREYKSGLGEVIKYGLALDAELFARIEGQAGAIIRREPGPVLSMIEACCRLKARIVEQDEYDEKGLRTVLNLGHTFGHAFEAASGFGSWAHGEAVSAGLICACCLAQHRGLVTDELVDRVANLARRFGLPTAIEPWPNADLLAAMLLDKKVADSRPRFIVPTAIGKTKILDDVTDDEICRTLEQCRCAARTSFASRSD
jgi:3-dehydroquinate synthase